MKSTITAGDSFKLSNIKFSEFKPSDGWTLNLVMKGTSTISLVAHLDSNGNWEFKSIASVTANWSPGKYNYVLYVSLADDQHTVKSGTVEIVQRADLAPEGDQRTWAEKALEAVEAVIEGKASRDQASYSIKGRSVSRYTFVDLMSLREELKRVIREEKSDGKVCIQRIHMLH